MNLFLTLEDFETIEDYIRITKEAAVQQAGRSIYSIKDMFLMEIYIQRKWSLILNL